MEKNRFDGQKETRLLLIHADDERKTIATIVELQVNKSEPKLFYLYYTLYFGEIKGPFYTYKSIEEAKIAAIHFLKEEAVKRMKELTYIINFIDEVAYLEDHIGKYLGLKESEKENG